MKKFRSRGRMGRRRFSSRGKRRSYARSGFLPGYLVSRGGIRL